MAILHFDGKYGADITLYFCLPNPASVGGAGAKYNRFVTTAPASLFATGDIKVSKNGGSFSNAANSVTQIAASNPLYKLVLSGSGNETNAEQVVVQIVDQDGPAWQDTIIKVRTIRRLGQLEVDASNLSNTAAATLTGVGTGHGLAATGSASGDISGAISGMTISKGTVPSVAGAAGPSFVKLDANASGADNFYVGCPILIVSGQGAGQFRLITAYSGTTKIATVNRSWSTNPASLSKFVILAGWDIWELAPAAELSTLPTQTSTFARMLQYVFNRFTNKRLLQPTSGTDQLRLTAYRDDSTTAIYTEDTVDDIVPNPDIATTSKAVSA